MNDGNAIPSKQVLVAERGSALGRFFRTYDRHVSLLAFIIGFALDYTSAPMIDRPSAPLIMGGYLALAACLMAVAQIVDPEKVERSQLGERMIILFPYAIQFLFGGLMSMLFVYYSRSASFAGSWPFMCFLGAMFVGNEVFHERLHRLEFQLVAFFFTLFMAIAVTIPVFLHRLGMVPFLISGAVSLAITVVFITFLLFVGKQVNFKRLSPAFVVIAATYLLINVFYFGHLIPPIPLALQSAAVYQSVEKNAEGNYVVMGETLSWKERYGFANPTIHVAPGGSASVYTSVFTPVTITAPIMHTWQSYDGATKKWTTLFSVTFPISGGRDGGYRGYSTKGEITPGRWRVLVTNESGEQLGSLTFDVVSVDAPPALVTSTI